MGKYTYPCKNHNISDGWDDHISRGSLGGIDFTCAYGSDVYAMADGVVETADTSSGGSGGRYISIRHSDGDRTQYLHLSKLLVSSGTRVSQGQLIAKSGASAYGSDYGTGGPHLHVHGVHANGVRFNVLPYISVGGSVFASTGITIDLGADMPLDDNDLKKIETALHDQVLAPLQSYVRTLLWGSVDGDTDSFAHFLGTNVANSQEAIKAWTRELLWGNVVTPQGDTTPSFAGFIGDNIKGSQEAIIGKIEKP